ncbi:crotonobetainyl-CoA--carnitine CoA-transferase [Rhodospirillum sp. A1_3_36]|uniref:crotonobetainyl-CoA--carnitine CoA-transferase n=1 Tax=Rhodospirillum sp. A1_3_36 TaxID=3391666 RepID=UPI0039A53D41
MQPSGIITQASDHESSQRDAMLNCLRDAPIPSDQLLQNIGLFIESKNLSRILLMDHLFRQIVDVHGSIMEFGTRWGQNMALFAALRGIYDPFNRHRKLVAFDTFEGFPSLHEKDGAHEMMFKGALSTAENYDAFLERVLTVHEELNPLNHIKKFEIRKGDASVEVDRYLKERPETIIALAFFDFDIYEPTRKVMELIAPRLTKGSVVAFDELNDPDSPGETLAVMETVGLPNVRLKKYRYASRVSYYVVE